MECDGRWPRAQVLGADIMVLAQQCPRLAQISLRQSAIDPSVVDCLARKGVSVSLATRQGGK
eukprot:733054-Rhodomonas_salina.4